MGGGIDHVIKHAGATSETGQLIIDGQISISPSNQAWTALHM
jgi:hypothetical protein